MLYPKSNQRLIELLTDDQHFDTSYPVGNVPYFLLGLSQWVTLGGMSISPGLLRTVPVCMTYETSLKELYLKVVTPPGGGNMKAKILIYRNVFPPQKATLYPEDLLYESPLLSTAVAGSVVGVSGLDVRVGPGYFHYATIFDHSGADPSIRSMGRTALKSAYAWKSDLSTNAQGTGFKVAAAIGAPPDPFPTVSTINDDEGPVPVVLARLELP